MVRAILNGTKTQTRRVVLPQPTSPAIFDDVSARLEAQLGAPLDDRRPYCMWMSDRRNDDGSFIEQGVRCPFGAVGDRLWVRETLARGFQRRHSSDPEFLYRADLEPGAEYLGVDRWTPSIFMPRRASRITLELTGVRVERLQALTAEGAIAEGVPSRGIEPPCIASAIMYLHDYEQLWNSLNAARGYGWDVNPWVWVLTFERVRA